LLEHLSRIQPESAILNLDPSSRLDAKAEAADQPGRLVALDLGTRRVGVAVSDELRITANTLPFIERRSWKDLLQRVASVIEAYDARGLVIGLPLALDGSESNAAQEAQRLAENFRRSLNVPVYLQDERLTSFEAGREMRAAGAKNEEIAARIDGEAAAIILRDFMARS
jgi:putative Holliday junction resolvase